MHELSYYSEWLEHNKKLVEIDGKLHRITVVTLNAIYPYKYKAISVTAEQIDKDRDYQIIKERLGDDWTIDVLSLDLDQYVNILTQCNSVISRQIVK